METTPKKSKPVQNRRSTSYETFIGIITFVVTIIGGAITFPKLFGTFANNTSLNIILVLAGAILASLAAYLYLSAIKRDK